MAMFTQEIRLTIGVLWLMTAGIIVAVGDGATPAASAVLVLLCAVPVAVGSIIGFGRPVSFDEDGSTWARVSVGPRQAQRTTSLRLLTATFVCIAASASAASAQELDRYRRFQLGSSLAAVAQEAGIAPDVRVVHRSPHAIEELTWEPAPARDSAAAGDSIRKVLFSFYDGELFRIVVNYRWDKTEGLTIADMVDSLSRTYGAAMLPATDIALLASRIHTDSDRAVAHWADSKHSVDLFRSTYTATFGLVVFSKRLDALARTASVEALRRDQGEATSNRIVDHQRAEGAEHDRLAKIRVVNKAAFRP